MDSWFLQQRIKLKKKQSFLISSQTVDPYEQQSENRAKNFEKICYPGRKFSRSEASNKRFVASYEFCMAVISGATMEQARQLLIECIKNY